MVYQDIGGALRPGAAVRADHAVSRQRHFDLRGLEPLVEQVRCRLSENLHQASDLAGAQAPKLRQQLQIVHEIGGLLRRQRWWRYKQQRFHDPGETFQPGFILGELLGVTLAELRNLCQGLALILPEEQMPPVGIHREEGRIFRDDVVPMLLQVQFPNDPLL